ncbi:MAG: hypothetical protein ACUZ8E_17090 [Candidatus Anammoxibacter sp.]
MNEYKKHPSQVVNRKSKSLVLILFCASIFFPLLTETSSVYAGPDHICAAYFYNPESNVDNFASLKSIMDQYLKKSGDCRFQLFVGVPPVFYTTCKGFHYK